MSENYFLCRNSTLGLYKKITPIVSQKISWLLDTYISIYEY